MKAAASSLRPLAGVGIGLRACHYQEFLSGVPPVDWLEVHSENYFGEGGYDLFVLDHVRQNYPVSLHGVGLALGSASDALRDGHLVKLKRLADRVQPALVSEHLCWGVLGERHLNDLLPIPYTEEALQFMVARVQQVQEVLQRPILIENVSAYLQFKSSTLSEFEFLAELTKRSGCGLLFDVNNLYVNSINHAFDPYPVLDVISPDQVGEIHLAGHARMLDVLVDDHGSRVCDPVWDLYEATCARFGDLPTLIEWDADIPPLEVLLQEAALARERMQIRHAA
jgi:uncharacterized protein (UPF0276 family)